MKEDIKQHEICKCKCRLDEKVCHNKQPWNKHKCRSECKKLIDQKLYDKEFIWNPSVYECDKSCDIGHSPRVQNRFFPSYILVVKLVNLNM